MTTATMTGEIAVAHRLLSECPVCRKPFPPLHGGRIRRRRRHQRIVETWAFWCLYCEMWWAVNVSKAVARRSRTPQTNDAVGAARFSKARRASRVEADQARRVLFLPKGLDEPVD